MNIDVKVPANEGLSAKLDELVAAVGSIQERQALNEEIQLELVKFLSATAQRQQEQVEALQREIHEKSEGLRSLGHAFAESQRSLFDALHKQVLAVGADTKSGIEARIRPIHDLAAMAVRKAAPVGGRIRCVFLIHAIETWDALADLHQAMLRDDRFTPIVATVNRRYPGQDSFGNEDKTSAFLTGLAVEHVRFGMQNAYQALDILKAMVPDVVFRQSQWDNDIPRAFAAAELQFTRLCFVPYASTIIDRYGLSENVQDTSSTFAYDQPCHRAAWRIFSETRFSAENYRRFHGYDPAKVVLSGFPKNERLIQSLGSDVWPIPGNGARRYRVIWAPHHSLGQGWLGFGVFHLIFERMLTWAMQRPDVDFVLKPHPALFSTAVKEAFVPREKIDRFEAVWRDLPNCAVCDGQYAELFASSDLLITDGISFLTEYQLFDKPLVFFDSRRHVPFNELGELAEAAAHVVSDFESLQVAVVGYMGGKPWERHDARLKLRQAMMPRDRSSVDIIMDEIAEGLGIGARTDLDSAVVAG